MIVSPPPYGWPSWTRSKLAASITPVDHTSYVLKQMRLAAWNETPIKPLSACNLLTHQATDTSCELGDMRTCRSMQSDAVPQAMALASAAHSADRLPTKKKGTAPRPLTAAMMVVITSTWTIGSQLSVIHHPSELEVAYTARRSMPPLSPCMQAGHLRKLHATFVCSHAAARKE